MPWYIDPAQAMSERRDRLHLSRLRRLARLMELRVRKDRHRDPDHREYGDVWLVNARGAVVEGPTKSLNLLQGWLEGRWEATGEYVAPVDLAGQAERFEARTEARIRRRAAIAAHKGPPDHLPQYRSVAAL